MCNFSDASTFTSVLVIKIILGHSPRAIDFVWVQVDAHADDTEHTTPKP